MAEVEASNTPSLAEQYLLKDNGEKSEIAAKSVGETGDKSSVNAVAEEVVAETEETPVSVDNEVSSAASQESANDSDGAAGESNETSPVDEATGEVNPAASEESTDSAEPEDAGEQEAEETPEIKLETAPADYRFPTTNQTRHCFTRYIEYHRCVAAKGEDAPECNKFAKYYRSICPSEWVCCIYYIAKKTDFLFSLFECIIQGKVK
ncbi:cytochrome c oxidase subunit 6b-1-like [Olea europaea subsp. europaea]|uniref:Cytochrome c oxidase subunit 6b-1-like n=1 Tax=Olea europaea subsp. europaea TaxID=158383 RepID=A0A8S0U3D0_OLEEU|nr:cytochrome c oxidase subunit 6b-1-like [Olea europaea subsp. europaea]